MKTSHLTKYITLHPAAIATLVVIVAVMLSLTGHVAKAQSLTAPYNPAMAPPSLATTADSIMLPFATSNAVPQSYEELIADELGADLNTPSNIHMETEYDPATRTYIVRYKVGNFDIATPLMLSERQYNNLQYRRAMQQYYRERNSVAFQGKE